MPVPPYNTGKIKIGCHYTKPQVNLHTPETDHWQSVILGDHARDKRSALWFFVWCCCVGAVAFLIFAFRNI